MKKVKKLDPQNKLTAVYMKKRVVYFKAKQRKVVETGVPRVKPPQFTAYLFPFLFVICTFLRIAFVYQDYILTTGTTDSALLCIKIITLVC